MANWHDVESARDRWVDAPLDDDDLEELLEVAKQAVIEYAPALPEPEDPEAEEDIPVNYRRAQLMHSRNLWNASTASTAGTFGEGEFVITPRPLDWHVQQMLRPKRGVPVVR